MQLPHRATNAVAPWITTQNGRFVDTRSGSPVVLRGVNVAVNSSAIVYDKAAAMGANFVRIMAPWSTVEPTAPDGAKHHWDEAFLQQLDAAVADFKKAGVNVLIDFHQFHWSPYFAKVECKQNVAVCNASGIPGLVLRGRSLPRHQARRVRCQEGVLDEPRRPAPRTPTPRSPAMMAARYADAPNVVGYEIFNEPHPGGLGDSTAATDTMLQWQAEIRRVIRAVDPTAHGVHHVPRRRRGRRHGRPEGVRLARPPRARLPRLLQRHPRHRAHVERQRLDAELARDPQPEGRRDTPAPRRRRRPCSRCRCSSTTQWRIPLLIGEWGIHTGVPGALEYQRQMLDLFDSEGVSWTRWNLARGGGFGLLQGTGSPTAEAIQLENALAGDYAVTGRARRPRRARSVPARQLAARPAPEPPHERGVGDARDDEVDRERRDAEADASVRIAIAEDAEAQGRAGADHREAAPERDASFRNARISASGAMLLKRIDAAQAHAAPAIPICGMSRKLSAEVERRAPRRR